MLSQGGLVKEKDKIVNLDEGENGDLIKRSDDDGIID